MGDTQYPNFVPFMMYEFEWHLYLYYFIGLNPFLSIDMKFKPSSDYTVQGNDFLHNDFVKNYVRRHKYLSAALCARIREIQYHHAIFIQILSCTPSWSTSYLCYIFHGCFVLPVLLMRKRVVSKVDMWIRWEYPSRTRGAGFRRVLFATKDIIMLFSLVMKT